MSEKKPYYISTAIAYTSAKPHIGNTYEILLAEESPPIDRRSFALLRMTNKKNRPCVCKDDKNYRGTTLVCTYCQSEHREKSPSQDRRSFALLRMTNLCLKTL